MDISSLYTVTTIPQGEGTNEEFHYYNPPMPICFVRKVLGFIVNEILFYLHGYVTSKYMEPPWGQKRHSLLLIFTRHKLKQSEYNTMISNQQYGRDIIIDDIFSL